MQVNSGLIVLKLNGAEGVKDLNLRQGQVLLARVSQLLDGEHARISMAGRQLVAKTEVRLHENTTVKLQVEGVDRDRVVLRLVSDRPQVMLMERPERLFTGTPLREGQVMTGSVIERQAGGQVKIQMGQQTLQAKANVNLENNQSLRLEVANLGPNRVLLNLVDEKASQSLGNQRIVQHLEALGARDANALAERVLSRIQASTGTNAGVTGEAITRSALQELAPRLATIEGAVKSVDSFAQNREKIPQMLGQILAGLEREGKGNKDRDVLSRVLSSFTITSNDPSVIRDQLHQAQRLMYLTPEQMVKSQLQPRTNYTSLAMALEIMNNNPQMSRGVDSQLQQLGTAVAGSQLLSSDAMGSAAQFFLPFLLDKETPVLVGFKRKKRDHEDQTDSISVNVDSPKLGKVGFKLALVEGGLNASVVVESKETKKLIEDNAHKLLSRMEAVGINFNIVNVSLYSDSETEFIKELNNKAVRINILV